MRVVIHDGNEEFDTKLKQKLGQESESIRYITDNGTIKSCIGCFGCWVKTPGQCVIQDGYGKMGELFARAEEVIVISKMTYGGYSPFVKNVFDRSISYIHPDFTYREGEMHHKRRYNNQIHFQNYFYGPATEKEKETAKSLIIANGKNLVSVCDQICFHNQIEDVLAEVNL